MFDPENRMTQHRKALERKDAKNSAIAEHWFETGHMNFNFENPAIYGLESNTNIRKVIEAFEIRNKNAKLNRSEEKGIFDPVWFLLNTWSK